ncbi:MAG: CHRD domain-containing protein, partial [Pyrinomonadaceae bacterium]
MKKRYILGIFVLVAIIGGLKLVPNASAQKEEILDQPVLSDAPENTTPQALPYSQNWTNIGLITANDDWSAVPGAEGYLGQDLTVATGTDPQTLLGTSALANDLDVIANQAAPDTNTSGGVGEFDGIANPVVALQGSGTADAPYVIFYVNSTGFNNVQVSYNLRDIDGSADNSIQPVALQYRVGNAGNFTNIGSAFVADASTGPSLATQVTPVSAVLGADANNQALVQLRVMTTNAVGSDEWIGVDDVSITGTPIGGGSSSSPKLFNGRLNSANEVPPNASTAQGFGRVVLNAAETQITVSMYWSGLSGNATAGHIHGPAAAGVNGPVIFNLAPAASPSGSVVNSTFSPTAAQVADLKAGLWYFNIHTAANPGGEI